jgi:hypothetical protein
MSRYASDTSVSSEKSRYEIETTLRRYGASSFMCGSSPTRAVIAFEANNRRVKFELPMPDPKSRDFTHTPGRGQLRAPAQQQEAYEQGVRQKWRALALCVKAKLEAVESGITTFEAEFLAHIVLPNGQTVGDATYETIERSYATGKMLPLIEGPK